MYAVVACSACRRPWLIETRHAKVTCPHCGRKAEVARRRRLWQGSDARAGQEAVAAVGHAAEPVPLGATRDVAAAQDIGDALTQERLVRHDDPLDAAAAQARGVRNQSERAEVVATWLARLVGETDHDTFVAALQRAGIASERAEKEVVRMLACDVIYEPRAGSYLALDA